MTKVEKMAAELRAWSEKARERARQKAEAAGRGGGVDSFVAALASAEAAWEASAYGYAAGLVESRHAGGWGVVKKELVRLGETAQKQQWNYADYASGELSVCCPSAAAESAAIAACAAAASFAYYSAIETVERIAKEDE